MPHDINDMVAVASGSKKQVGIWVKNLWAATIDCLVVTATGTTNVASEGNTELWVASDEAGEARSAIRSAESPGRGLMC